jgi:hypothetical protein
LSSKGVCRILTVLFLFSITVHAQQSPDPPSGTASAPPDTPAKIDKRLFGVLPNYRTTDANQPFKPLSSREKLNIARHDSFDWPTYVTAGVLTLATPGGNKTYGGGVEGFANRYVRWTADQITGNMLTEGFMPVLFHQDPRYFRPGTGTISSRLRTALGQIVVARNDSGKRMFNASEFLGNAMAVGISNSYSSDLNSWHSRSEKLILMISTDTFSNVMKEFGPDIKERLLHHRHAS